MTYGIQGHADVELTVCIYDSETNELICTKECFGDYDIGISSIPKKVNILLVPNDNKFSSDTYNEVELINISSNSIPISNSYFESNNGISWNNWDCQDLGGNERKAVSDVVSNLPSDSPVKSALRFFSGIGSDNRYARRFKELNRTMNRITFSIEMYIERVDQFSIRLDGNCWFFVFQWRQDGLFTRDESNEWVLVTSDIVKECWEVWTFDMISLPNNPFSFSDIYKNGNRILKRFPCGRKTNKPTGKIFMSMSGEENQCLFIDWFKIGNGLIYVNRPF